MIQHITYIENISEPKSKICEKDSSRPALNTAERSNKKTIHNVKRSSHKARIAANINVETISTTFSSSKNNVNKKCSGGPYYSSRKTEDAPMTNSIVNKHHQVPLRSTNIVRNIHTVK